MQEHEAQEMALAMKCHPGLTPMMYKELNALGYHFRAHGIVQRNNWVIVQNDYKGKPVVKVLDREARQSLDKTMKELINDSK